MAVKFKNAVNSGGSFHLNDHNTNISGQVCMTNGDADAID